MIIRCTVFDPREKELYELGPRATARKAEAYLKKTGIADQAIFGPETEFFIFDSVSYHTASGGCAYQIKSAEAFWSSGNDEDGNNSGYHIREKAGYFSTSPMDTGDDIRAEICHQLKEVGIAVEVHHHEVATAGQSEVVTRFNTLTQKADELQDIKYVAKNVAASFNKSVTFMPKPLATDNGSGLHVHQSLFLDGKNIFAGDVYAGLSQEALYYIGGIIKHGKALNAFTNASINSYRRLLPGFEAPIYLAYSAQNRSASIRIPFVGDSVNAVRIEVRFPDGTMNPYLAFSAMLMAGLDGIKNKIDPGEAADKNLYELTKEEADDYPSVCSSLEEALNCLKEDHAFLLEGGVFAEEQIENYIKLKMQDVEKMRPCAHPLEFEMYYDL
jgi:glutamine synthetase